MILPASDESTSLAAEILCGGGLAAIPTETVYGLGADAMNPAACAEIFRVKRRPFFDPLIVHIADWETLDNLVISPPQQAIALAQTFWPGPLTIVLEKRPEVPDIVTSGLTTVAVRMPSHPVALDIIRKAGRPIAAPSANPFGYLSPTEAVHVEEQLGADIGLIIDGGSCAVGLESTIIRVTHDGILLLRPGGISVEAIEAAAGRAVRSAEPGSCEAPGQLEWHYAPLSKLVIVKEGERIPDTGRCALLAFRENRRSNNFCHTEILSPSGSMTEAATRLFSALHRLDESGADIIYAEAVPETGLGLAVMNRLKKAAAR